MKWRSLWYVLGVAMIAWGARGLLTTTSTRQLIHAGRLVVLDVGGHDGVFAPLAFVLGLASQRLLPLSWRAPVRIGLAFGGLLVILAMPVILSDHRGRTSSSLPLPYERNLVILLGFVALGVVASIGVRAIRARAQSRTPAPQS